MSSDMDLFELILFEAFITLIFVCFFITSAFFTGHNLFLILLSLAFGLFTIPFSATLGGWWTLLKMQERSKLRISIDENRPSARWVYLDFGLKGNARLFRIMSVVIALFAVYNLISYFSG
jgi:hypothetical protein